MTKRCFRRAAVVCLMAAAFGAAAFGVRATRPAAAQEAVRRPLQGAAALEQLKQDGQYDSLQEAMSQARFAVSRAGATPLGRAAWHAPNAAAGYDAYVTENGVSIALDEKTYVSLHLQAIGYGEALRAVGPGHASGEKQTIRLAREAGLQEWYINGPEGLEQGFTLSEPPAGPRQKGTPLRLAMEVGEGWRAAASEDGGAVTLRGEKGEAIEYGKLVARDRLGRTLASRLTVAGERVVIEVEEHDAAYPLTIDPLFTLQQKLQLADGATQDFLGHSVAIDGNTAIVGAPYDDVTKEDQGAAYVFVRSGATWTQQARLTASDAAVFDLFGWAVAIDGDTALVGAYNGPGAAGPDQGAAYVFVRSGRKWTQQARLNASDGMAAGLFGTSLALDGNTALIGAACYRVSPTLAPGAAYVFTRSGTAWTQQARLTFSAGADDDRFGQAVALDGDTALIGTPGAEVGANTNQGSVYVFTRNGTLWGARQTLNVAEGAPVDLFGGAVAISGNTALIGAAGRGNEEQGIVYAFERGAGGSWALTGPIGPARSEPLACFGVSVALSGDTAVIGASFGLFAPGVDHRSAYVFARSGHSWRQIRQLGPGLGSADDRFGYAVAIDENTVLAGAFQSDAAAGDQGAAYVFTIRDSQHIERQRLSAGDGAAGDRFGNAVALSGDTLVVGAENDDIGANVDQGSACVFTRSGATWSFQQKLTANDGAAKDHFGHAVAIDGSTIAVGAYADDIGGNADQGSAYVFTRSGTSWTFRQQLRAIAIDGLPGDNFGISVAVSGETIAAGASGADESRGVLYVFTPNGAIWTQQAKLWGYDAVPFQYFGCAIALQGDTLAAGAYGDTIGPNLAQGSVYLFTRSGGAWTAYSKLTAADGAQDDRFGIAVALNGDAVAVGAARDDIGSNADQGSAYVFARVGASWLQLQKLAASDGAAGDQFGMSVALGETILAVGAGNDAIGANAAQGSAYVYTYSGAYWLQQQKLKASDGAANDRFGVAVAVSGDAVAVGASGDTVGTRVGQGSAYLFASPLCPAITLAPASLPGGTVGAAYSQQLTAGGGTGEQEYTFSVSGGALPFGLTLNRDTGLLSGTPTAAGTYRFTITATFELSLCSGSRDYTITIAVP